MPDSIESFANIAKYSTKFLSFILSFEESIVDVNELIHSGITGTKPDLERSDNIIAREKVKNMFMNQFFKIFFCEIGQ